MYVYLKYGNSIKRFLDVDLVDSVYPQVGGVSVSGTNPTVWFKVLILDSILVDCDEREVYWNKEPVVEATTIHWNKDEDLEVGDVLPFYHNQGKMFEDGCNDFVVEIEELFEIGRSIVDELDGKAIDHLDVSEAGPIKRKLFRLLHMFILPKLILRKSEMKDVQSAVTDMEQQQKDTELNIATKEKIKYRTGRFLEKQRVAMLTSQDFSSERTISEFNYEFLQHFLKHIETDIDTGNKVMMEYEDKIAPLRTCQTIREQEVLNYWRDQRDKNWSHINKAIAAREAIKNVIIRPGPRIDRDDRVHRETAIHPDHIVYLETSCRLQRMEQEVCELKDRLVKMELVKGTALQAIREIEEHGQSLGKQEDLKEVSSGRKPEINEWSSLSKKVEDLVSAKPLGFRDKHNKFCKKIISDIKKLADDPKTRSSLDGNEKPPKSGDKKSGGFITFQGGFMDQNVSVLTEEICNEIIKHTLEMTWILAEELYQRPHTELSTTVIENIYICYEAYVSGELMPVLFKLFEDSYKQQCEAVTRCFSQISLSESLLASIDKGTSVTKRDIVTKIQRKSDGSGTASANLESQKVLDMFDSFVKDEADERMSVFTNMRTVLEIIQYIVKQAKNMGRKSSPVCSDDILDVLIPLLQKLSPETFLKTYAHITL